MASGKLSPIKKTYSSGIQTQEKSLADNGLFRYPGTTRVFTPSKIGNQYKTGLDKNSLYMRKLQKDSPEKYKEECEWIDKAVAKLKDFFGTDIDLSPTSKLWNAYSEDDGELHVVPVKAGTEDVFFNFEDSMQFLSYCWIRVENTVAPSLEAYARGGYPDAQYYIADEDAESKLTYSRKKAVNKAIVDFEQLSVTKKRRVARLMGLPVTDETKEETVYNLMDTALKQSEFKDGVHKGLSTINVFNDIVRLGDARLEVKDLVQQALSFNIYRKGLGGKITEGSQTIAGSEDELIEKLSDEANQQDKLALEARLKQKKSD